MKWGRNVMRLLCFGSGLAKGGDGFLISFALSLTRGELPKKPQKNYHQTMAGEA